MPLSIEAFTEWKIADYTKHLGIIALVAAAMFGAPIAIVSIRMKKDTLDIERRREERDAGKGATGGGIEQLADDTFPSESTDSAAFQRNPGDGRVAGRLIERASDTESARSIFNGFRTSPRQVDHAYPYAEFISRLEDDLLKIEPSENGTFDDGWEATASMKGSEAK